MRAVAPLPQPATWVALAVAVFLTGCDSPQKRGLRELAKIGVEPTGTALLDAVRDHDIKRTGWLLDVGVYTEQRDAEGRTPLRVATENQDVAAAYKLLDAHADVNARSTDHASILGVAVQLGETAMVDRMLAAGASPSGLMPGGEQILPWAIRNGRMTFVRSMFKAGADPHLKDAQGNPLLHVAMQTGRRDLTEALLQLGADAAAVDAKGESTLELALAHGWFDLVPKLANAGADPNLTATDGTTPLERAVNANDLKLVDLLLKIGADPLRRDPTGVKLSPFEKVFKTGNRELFEAFLAHGTQPANGDWETLLWQAFEQRELATARLVLDHGARGAQRSAKGNLLVEEAVAARAGSFVKLLLDYGCPHGRSMFDVARRGDLEMAGLLTSYGLPVNVTQLPSRETPLSLAMHHRHDDVASLLIHRGASLQLRLPEGQPPLHVAIATGCSGAVRELLAAGADANQPFRLPVSKAYVQLLRPGLFRWALQNERNVTPLMLAADAGNVEVARLLLKAGAKTETWTRGSSLWPINFASNRDDVKMMRLFLGKDPANEVRRIEISLSEQKVHIYDAQGNEIFTTKVSTGRKGFATKTGTFVITNKHRDWTSTLYHASMPYFQRLSCGDFGMHQGVVPGYPASHGCIRVPEGVAAKLFALTETGDRVSIMP